MLKVENVEVLGWEHAIRVIRTNPKFTIIRVRSQNMILPLSWSDISPIRITLLPRVLRVPHTTDLMNRLRNAGTDHRKFMRMITVYLDITAPLYWWKEFDTYKVGTVANSCSTMHKIADKKFTLEDFSCEHLNTNRVLTCYAPTEYHFSSLDLLKLKIDALNYWREKYLEFSKIDEAAWRLAPKGDGLTDESLTAAKKNCWWQMIQLLPSSYNQRRTVMLNYEVLANIYKSRRHHKLDEWHTLCDWIESLPYSELITGTAV